MNNTIEFQPSMKGLGMKILDTQFKQRAYDGKWERVVKVPDHDNSYAYTTEGGNVITILPEKWITVGVYDLLGDWAD
jgi:hypothetical protein